MLVGRAFGGTVARVCTSRYPGTVAGLVRVDAPSVAPDPVVPPKPDGTCCEQGPFARGENPERGDQVASERQTET